MTEIETYDLNRDENDRMTFQNLRSYLRKNYVPVDLNARKNQEFQIHDTIFEINERQKRISVYSKNKEKSEFAKARLEEELKENLFINRI